MTPRIADFARRPVTQAERRLERVVDGVCGVGWLLLAAGAWWLAVHTNLIERLSR